MPPDGALPEPLILSSEVLDEGGVYLLDSGADLLLYLDQSVNEQVVQVTSFCSWRVPSTEACFVAWITELACACLPLLQQRPPWHKLKQLLSLTETALHCVLAGSVWHAQHVHIASDTSTLATHTTGQPE